VLVLGALSFLFVVGPVAPKDWSQTAER
jgi:hypothetical protein